MHIKTRLVENPERALSTNRDKSLRLLDKLRYRAEQIGYGSLICEIQVHEGRIKQVDVTTVKERIRAD